MGNNNIELDANARSRAVRRIIVNVTNQECLALSIVNVTLAKIVMRIASTLTLIIIMRILIVFIAQKERKK